MGFTEPTEVFQVTFVDYPGLEITTRDVSIAEMGTMMVPTSVEGVKNTAQKDEMITKFIDKVVTWNLQHRVPEGNQRNEDGTCVRCGLAEGDLLPTTVFNFKCCSMKFMMKVTMHWAMSVTGVQADLKKLLTNGGANEDWLMKKLASIQSPPSSAMPS